jgi:tetratricopeptide (TPR) repeat protein
MPRAKNPTRAELEALDRAQQRIYDAWEAARPATRAKRAKEALAISPLCADAHVILAQLAPPGSAECLAAWQAGVEAGAAALGPKGFKEMEGEFWGWLETRPYMRARLGLAMALRDRGEKAEAAGHLRALLRLNPNDNQGVRGVLASLLLELGEEAELAALLDRYEHDDGADMAWPRVLLAFRQGGDSAAARKARAAAAKDNPHVPKLLTGALPMPKEPPPYYSPGDITEAAAYLHYGEAAWRATPGALEWLAASMETPPARRRGKAKGT